MIQWWNRNAAWLAAVFVIVGVVLGMLAIAQAIDLHARGWRWDLGTVPAWVGGIGSFAAFGALWVAAQQWRLGQADRRLADEERRALAETRDAERQDHLISQARLIVVESVRRESQRHNRITGELAVREHAVIRNHSSEPVFNLHVEHESTKGKNHFTQEYQPERDTDDDNHFHPYLGIPFRDTPVLGPGQATADINIVNMHDTTGPFNELVVFTFTDARGARWRRIGSRQPVRILGETP